MDGLPNQAVNAFAGEGGILGLIILLLVSFIGWYIYTSHRYHDAKEKREAEERAVWAKMQMDERREWKENMERTAREQREALDRNTDAFHSLEKALFSRPCLRPTTMRTRHSDRACDE